MINSYNEWDRLKRVVVGDASHANWPRHDPVFSAEAKNTLWKETPLPKGPVPQWIIDEANQDLQTLADTLTAYGVEVVRPDPLNFQVHDGLYNYCPRDRLIVHGSTIINPAMMYPCRDMELQCYHDIVDEAEHYYFMPRNEGMVLDAANVLRLGPDKMLFLESTSGNRAAYDWLCKTLPNVEIELCNFYAGVHIDSTIVALNADTFIVNGSRVTADTLPRLLRDKTIIMINDVVAQEFYQYPYASKWIALNMLSIDPRTVIVDAAQQLIIGMLEALDFTVVPLTLRHSRTLGGGFHCVTLDLVRG
jgi:scyllo-inosamine-4-phosphate amidinotransferase 1